MTDFIEQALILLTGALILVPLFQKLGFGSVVGYLMAGLVIGPFGLKLVSDSESILHFSELGVVLLLFIIGLEIQPSKLWAMRQHLLGLGGLQILFCTIVFSGIGLLLGFPFISSTILGFALSLSSTAFAAQTLTEKNLFNTEFGRASFAVLLSQDLAAIPALALIPVLALNAAGGDVATLTMTEETSTWRHILLICTVLIFVFVASRWLIRPIFRLIASTKSRDIFTAVTLFVVMGVAVLMQKVGLSAAFGTFIAGVLLADSEYRHELETNLEPFKGLLMGLFFVAVGMSVNTPMIVQNFGKVIMFFVGYFLLKASIIYLVGRLFKLNHLNSKLMALNISQGGEFAFVIFGLVTKMTLATSESIDLLTAVITISMAATPLVIFLEERLSRRFGVKTYEVKYDEIKDENPKVIVAGFGRFGQIFARILRAEGIPFIAIDHDADQIELARKFGSKVYYGDASRLDLLETAGAKTAKYFVLAIDNVQMSLKTAAMVKEHFPNLKIFARARNRGHTFDLMKLGIENIKRETFDSSVSFVSDLLVAMDYEPARVEKLIHRFCTHEELMLKEQFKHSDDQKSLISLSKQSAAQLAQVLKDDSLQSRIK